MLPLVNRFWFGSLVGLLTPLVGVAFALVINDAMLQNRWLNLPQGGAFQFSERTCVVLGICAVLLPFRYYQRRRCDRTISGMVLPILVYAVAFTVWTLYFPTYRFWYHH